MIRVRRGKKGWWFGPFSFEYSSRRYYGPYATRKDAMEDKEGLLVFFKQFKQAKVKK